MAPIVGIFLLSIIFKDVPVRSTRVNIGLQSLNDSIIDCLNDSTRDLLK